MRSLSITIRNRKTQLFYAFIIASMLWKLVFPGGIFNLDYIPIPSAKLYLEKYIYSLDTSKNYESIPTSLFPRFPYHVQTSLSILVLTSFLVQKIYYVLVFLLAAVASYRLSPTKKILGKLFVSLIYTINPFTYSRVLAGHVPILFAYALLPVLIEQTKKAMDNGTIKNRVVVGLLVSLVWIFSVHMFAIGLFLIFSLFLFGLKKDNARKRIKGLALIFCVFFVTGIYWIVPYFHSPFKQTSFMSQRDVEFFRAKARPYGSPLYNPGQLLSEEPSVNVILETVSMYGFWYQDMIHPKDNLPFWYLFYAIILYLSVKGFLAHRKDRTVQAITIAGIIGGILAIGTSHQWTAPVYEWLFQNIVYFRAFREPQKFVALLALMYAYLGGLGVGEIEKGWKGSKGNRRKVYAGILGLCLVTPLIYTHTMFFGFSGQLKPTDYPESWYQVNEYLNEQGGEFNTIFYPWHDYLYLNWTDGMIANPAPTFFKQPVIVPCDVTRGCAPTLVKYVEWSIENENNTSKLLAPLNVKYIILAKDTSRPLERYEHLFSQENITLILNTSDLYLFRNDEALGKMYEVNESVAVVGGKKALNEVDVRDRVVYLLEQIPWNEVEDYVNRSDYVFYFNRTREELALLTFEPLEPASFVTIYDRTWLPITYHFMIEIEEGEILRGDSAIQGNGRLDIPLQVKEDGNYELWARMWGNCTFTFAGEVISTGGNGWVKVAEAGLNRGEETLGIESAGIVIDDIVLALKGELEEKVREIERLSEGKGEGMREEVSYTKLSPVEYEVENGQEGKYLVFTSSYAEDWRLDGEEPLRNLGGLNNVYEDWVGGTITYERTKWYLLGYGISLFFWVILLSYVLIAPFRKKADGMTGSLLKKGKGTWKGLWKGTHRKSLKR